MGGEQSVTRKALDNDVDFKARKDNIIPKILLLGPGESGKSTFFKQLRKIHSKDFTDEERRDFIPTLQRNSLEEMKILIKFSIKLAEDGLKTTCLVPEEAQKINDYDLTSPLNSEIVESIKTVWKDPGIQETWKSRHLFHIDECGEYLFSRVDEFIKPNYLPTFRDMLQVRLRTTGILDMIFEIGEKDDKHQVRIVDVGGQRNERRKWIHCFSDVDCVLFIASVDDYDRKLYEEEDTNRMVESLGVWREIVNSKWFKKSCIILLLNKTDRLKNRLATNDLTLCPVFSDYTGGKDLNSALNYINKKFTDEIILKRPLESKFTCLLNDDEVLSTFDFIYQVVRDFRINKEQNAKTKK